MKNLMAWLSSSADKHSKLAIPLENAGIPIIGTSPTSIDLAEDRKKFGEVLKKLKIRYPNMVPGRRKMKQLQLPGELDSGACSSFVCFGRKAMEIVYNEHDIRHYMRHAVKASPNIRFLLIISGRCLWIWCGCHFRRRTDGYGGIMQHIEEAGFIPATALRSAPYMVTEEQLELMRNHNVCFGSWVECNRINQTLQYAIQKGILYILEVNPRASRTVPFVSKATGVHLPNWLRKW